MTTFRTLLRADAPAGVFFVRLGVGLVFLLEGVKKFLFSADWGVGRFTRIGIPHPGVLAPFVGAVEVACGAMLLLGLLTRLAALPLLVDISVAILTTKIPILLAKGFWPMQAEARTDFAMLTGLLCLAATGGGPWSLDARLWRGGGTAGSRGAGQAAALAVLAVLPLSAGACARPPQPAPYAPRTRDITVTTVPLLVKEDASVFPFLKQDFAPGGVLENKEVYGFSPSTITVVEGDTIRFTFINPEDDVHSFVLPDFSVALPGQHVTHATYVARRAGIFPFECSIPTHLPMMWGQLVVLPARAMAGTGAPAGDSAAGR